MRLTSIRNFVFSLSIIAASKTAITQSSPSIPRITGISNIAYFVSDLPKALQFWHNFLGFDEDLTAKAPGIDNARVVFIKINDHQSIELLNEQPTSPPGMMSHLCFAVDDIEAMRSYLKAKGYDIQAATKSIAGQMSFTIKDPDGTTIEFAQPLPADSTARSTGKFLPSTRISTAIFHAGFIVGNSEKSVSFYRDILGFRETWRGSSNGIELSWINMQVPGDADYIELMLYNKVPGNYGSSNHTSLVVPNIQQAIDTLRTRAAAAGYTKPLEIHEGKNHKRQVNLFDPDGTRVELMEPTTVDGKPAPSSQAPPPP